MVSTSKFIIHPGRENGMFWALYIVLWYTKRCCTHLYGPDVCCVGVLVCLATDVLFLCQKWGGINVDVCYALGMRCGYVLTIYHCSVIYSPPLCNVCATFCGPIHRGIKDIILLATGVWDFEGVAVELLYYVIQQSDGWYNNTNATNCDGFIIIYYFNYTHNNKQSPQPPPPITRRPNHNILSTLQWWK